MKRVYLLALLLFLGCATNIKKEPREKKINMGVDISSHSGMGDRQLPNIESNQNQKNSIGPFPIVESDAYLNKKKSVNKSVIGLILGPGINRVLCHIPILKELEIQGQPIHVITGTGMGAVVASLYSSGMKPDKIEWIFYNFSKKVKGIRPYSKKWIEAAKSILLKGLTKKKIQNTKIRLAIPKFNKTKQRVDYITRGRIKSLLIDQHLSFNTNNSTKGIVPFQKEVFNQSKLIKLGADKTIAIDVLDNKIEFEITDHYLTGIFGRITGIIGNEKERIDIFITMSSAGMPLDSTKLLPGYLQNCMVRSREVVKRIKSTLEIN